MTEIEDVIVIGGGPAGLAAALWLARYRLRVLLFDAGNPRNAPTWGVHGYLGLEDPAPEELRALGRGQAEAAGARCEDGCVVRVAGERDAFEVEVEGRGTFRARRLLFCTGLRDIIPEIPGLLECYGETIYHCPDCDGPTVTGKRVGVIGWGREIAAFCMQMLTWAKEVAILTHGHEPEMPERAWEVLTAHGVTVCTEPIERIVHSGARVECVRFADGPEQPFDALFFHIAYGPGSSLPAALGCEADEDGLLQVGHDLETSVPGVYAAGDITPGSKLAIRAAAEGTRAAIAIFRGLLPEEKRV
jgi:thioredoxin reductase